MFAIDVASGNAKLLADKGTNEAPRVAGDHPTLVRDLESATVPTG